MTSQDQQARARRLAELHADTTLLTVVNVWDVISAKAVAAVPGTTALATASHSIAASHGYEDGENIPLAEMIDAVGRIASATDLPVSADLEGGYGNAAETIRRAIGVGIVGANLEDQMRPLSEAAAQVSAVMAAASEEGVEFALNARTDAFALRRDRDGGERIGDRSPIRVVASAVAEASAPVSSWTGMPSQAEGGGYSGPLAYRDGEPLPTLFSVVSGRRTRPTFSS